MTGTIWAWLQSFESWFFQRKTSWVIDKVLFAKDVFFCSILDACKRDFSTRSFSILPSAHGQSEKFSKLSTEVSLSFYVLLVWDLRRSKFCFNVAYTPDDGKIRPMSYSHCYYTHFLMSVLYSGIIGYRNKPLVI